MTTGSHDVLIRPMAPEDLPAAEALSARAYYEVDLASYQRAWPEPVRRSPERGSDWQRRTGHLLETDPAGCWVADRGGEVVGIATSLVRELMWVLASYAVTPGQQGSGIGRQLLAAALAHGRGCLRGMLNASPDPRAARLYRSVGFALHPQMLLWGHVSRADLPVGIRHVRDGGPDDFDLMDSIDRRVRGAAHGPDHPVMAERFRLLVSDRPAGSGYAYVDPAGGTVVLAATHRKTARSLMWEGLAGSDPEVPVEIGHVTAANQWALDVALEARLAVYNRGFLAVRHLRPPAPYLPHPTFL
ncbi:GNAT family N-acetyltransferase [Nocardioides sp.]|uniref:GNAT family N-acetyltransferase n=1 Tax=Nocardioides sp. TaxID=35761 RepID=UPI003527E7DA